MQYSTMPQMSTDMLSSLSPKSKVSDTELSGLLRGRKFNKPKSDGDFDMCPPIPSYEDSDMIELEQYCRSRGIVGVNFGSKSPREILNFLKGKTEGKSVFKKGLLNG